MKQPEGHHLAQLNIGRLLAPTGDPRVADFMNNLDRINGLGKRSPGFVWMMEGSGAPGTGNTENNLGDDPQMVTNLSVWTDVVSLGNFVWNTVHRQFYQRRAEWFEVMGDMHFVMWWIPAGHRPSQEEAMAHLGMLRNNGPSDAAFGWDMVPEAAQWQERRCTGVAAE